MKEINVNAISFKNGNIYIHDEMLCNPQNIDSVEDIKNESANFYIVAESGYGNFALLSFVSAFDESEAAENANIAPEHYEDVCSIEQVKIVA